MKVIRTSSTQWWVCMRRMPVWKHRHLHISCICSCKESHHYNYTYTMSMLDSFAATAQPHDSTCHWRVLLFSPSRGASFAWLLLVIDSNGLLICVSVLICCIRPFGSIVRVLQPQVLFPSTIDISPLETSGDDIRVLKVLRTTQR